MYYRIADITFLSQLPLPSFSAFACEPSKPDAVLEITDESAPDGSEVTARGIAYRKIDGGWFIHSTSSSRTGLIVSGDYSRMRLIRDKAGPVTLMERHYVRVALECLLVPRGFVSLHSACVSLDGQAIAFTGDSGMGKSTRARAWQEAFGASFVSGDRPLICVKKPEAFGAPWDGKENCFLSVHYPLLTICDIRRAETVCVRKLTAAQKRLLLIRQCFMPMWDADLTAMQMMNIIRLVSSAKIVRVFCGPRAEDAKTLRRMLDMQQELEEKTDMKAKSGFVLRNIADEYILIPTGDNINQFKGTLLLNAVSAFIWDKLQVPVSRDDLLTAVMEEYEVDEKSAAADLDMLLKKLRDYGVLIEE